MSVLARTMDRFDGATFLLGAFALDTGIYVLIGGIGGALIGGGIFLMAYAIKQRIWRAV